MNNRLLVTLSGILVLLCILAGLLWWAIGLHRGAFQKTSAGGYGVMLLAFALFQLAAWAVAWTLFLRFRNTQREIRPWPLITLAAVLALATLLWGVTPVLGTPLMLVVIVAGTVTIVLFKRVAQ